MAKKNKTIKKTNNVTVTKSAHRTSNIIVSVVGGITALILIAIAVLCAVRVDPLDKLESPERYDFYDLGKSSTSPESTNDNIQSKLRNAMSDMDFNIMSAILQWNWDYSYNFVRNTNGDKIKMSAEEVDNIAPSSEQYMVEYIYKSAEIVDGEVQLSSVKSLNVDGETVYFDRVKVLIGNSDGSVGEIYLYPYIYDRVKNKVADDGVAYETYTVTAVKVRANTSDTYVALGEIATLIKNG